MTGYRGRVQSGAVAGGRIARLLLLACTLFGLAAMHTIGHGGVDHVSHHDEPQAAVGDTVSVAASSSLTPVVAAGGRKTVDPMAGAVVAMPVVAAAARTPVAAVVDPMAAAVGSMPVAVTAGRTPVAADAAPMLVAADGCDCGHGAMQPLGGGGMAGWGLCVAVLGALAVALLLAALLLAALTGRYPPRQARAPGRTAPRAPPVLPFGLTLATVSVLRT
jgi:FlaG/FlaF family flagellin (archaellin)